MRANIPKNPTRRERELELEKRAMVKRTLETCMLAFALVLGDEGNGKKRIDRHLNEFVNKLDYLPCLPCVSKLKRNTILR